MMSFSSDDQYVLIANQKDGFGLVALERNNNDILGANPASVLGASGFNPRFVQQIELD
jgi:hypothetical protein